MIARRTATAITGLVAIAGLVTACSSGKGTTPRGRRSHRRRPGPRQLRHRRRQVRPGEPSTAGPCGHTSAGPATYEHVIWIVLENENATDVLGNRVMPFTNGLAAACGTARNYRALLHPSLPNYIAMTSGDTQGVTDDAGPDRHRLAVRASTRRCGRVGASGASVRVTHARQLHAPRRSARAGRVLHRPPRAGRLLHGHSRRLRPLDRPPRVDVVGRPGERPRPVDVACVRVRSARRTTAATGLEAARSTPSSATRFCGRGSGGSRRAPRTARDRPRSSLRGTRETSRSSPATRTTRTCSRS